MSSAPSPGCMARLGRHVEKLVGVTTAGLVGVLVIALPVLLLGGGGGEIDGPVRWYMVPFVVAAVVAMAVEGVCLCAAYDALGRDQDGPFAPALAVRFGRLPRAIRPAAVVWWVAHFAVGTGFAVLMEVSIAADDTVSHVYGRYGWAAQSAVFVVVGFTLAFAFNLYALLAVSAAGFGRRAVLAVWRWRFALDIAVAVAAAVVAGQIGPDPPPTRRPPSAVRATLHDSAKSPVDRATHSLIAIDHRGIRH